MSILVIALSRLVPILFLVSLTLIGSRYLHDLVLAEHPRLARISFAAVALVGLVATAPYAIRGGLIIAATKALHERRWKAADLLLNEYDQWKGARTDEFLRSWAYARENSGDWTGAEEILAAADPHSPQIRLVLGICQYNRHDPSAEGTLASIPDASGTQLFIRDYLLARIFQHRGDPGRAFYLYGRSAHWQPLFFPSTYHGARLALIGKRPAAARTIVDDFVRRDPLAKDDPDIATLRQAIRTGAIPADKEFTIVSN